MRSQKSAVNDGTSYRQLFACLSENVVVQYASAFSIESRPTAVELLRFLGEYNKHKKTTYRF